MSTDLPPDPSDPAPTDDARSKACKRSLEINPPLPGDLEPKLRAAREEVKDAVRDAFSDIYLMIQNGVQPNEQGRRILPADRQRYIGYIAEDLDRVQRQVQVTMIDMLLDPAHPTALHFADHTAVLERLKQDKTLAYCSQETVIPIIRHTLGIWLERDYLQPADVQVP